MSANSQIGEAERWYQQAVDDLEAASALLNAQKYAQACFYAQQAAEKSLNAVWYFLDLDPWGHSCGRLITTLPEAEQKELLGVLNPVHLGICSFQSTP